MTDTNKLKELAEKLAPAYQQPWESHRHSASAVTVGAVGEDGEYSDFIDVRISDYSAFDEHDDELGQWIAAANPKTILALLDENDRLKAENAKLSEALDECDGDRWKLRSERDAANARLHEVAAACATAEHQRDAALANVDALAVQVLKLGGTISFAHYPAAQAGQVPEVSGIGRDTGHPRAVVLYLHKEPTDDDLRAIQDGLRSLAAAPQPAGGE
ncbi:ead/Ea22-like family protein [Pseudomonas aeruginosa]